ncbi:DNA-3-methyladenine glycosylase 2 family protein [Paenibacillus tritici]|jgi:DNA-3-methyladenine glycosylase II|uniref:DNA-3-methyladenine glycosylase family protein n=1 Tax=Paenibacillus tritici TaxID=1873425 RepID=UPI001BA73989|nr:DNA-3-methyladenine glycosylase [Paenibacillus tritici]QUL55301.1 DNA-3-methyladenine glycosylase 2 family protein [Paenibacillus tritici]
MNDLLFELPLPEDFSLDACLEYMNRSPLECLFRTDEAGVTRMFKLEDGPVLIRLNVSEENRLSVTLLHGSVPGVLEQEWLARYIVEWFDLDRDLTPFYRLAEADPLLRPLVSQHRGLRIIGIPDLFEALCWAILGQQVNLAFAYRLKHRLTEVYGESLEQGGQTYYRFPGPEVFAEVQIEELCALQLTRSKAQTILTVASLIASGELSREELLALPSPADAEQRLLKIRGIGPWTSQYVRMRCLRDSSSFPVGDVGLQNVIKFLTGMDRKPTPAELLVLARPWQGWEAYATFYLWRALY